MSTIVLGISAFYHDSAAAIVRDGEIVACAQEERFSRKKHDPRFPHSAINYCLEEAYIEPAELDAVVFYDNPLLTWDRVVKSCMAGGENSFEQFGKACRSVLGVKMWVQDKVRQTIGSLGKAGRLLFSEHHKAHAASAFYPSPFQRAAVVTLDGVGEWETTTLGMGADNGIEIYKVINYPHSIGLLYSAFTQYCGFKVNSGEYKLMGLSPYGEPTYYTTIRDELIDIKDDGSYRLNTAYLGYLDSLSMTNDNFHRLFGGKPRQPESRITRREMDLAASIQKVVEEVVLRLASHARKETGCSSLVMAGGVALNCVANGELLSKKIFEEIWIQPASGDAGGALGAALLATHVYFGLHRPANDGNRDRQKGSYLGPAYGSPEVEAFLQSRGYPYERITDPDHRARVIAEALAEGKVIGYFQGRMEFGPRALGSRSIIGDPRHPDMLSRVNMKIKFREPFRPLAPSVLLEHVSEYFELEIESPYMLLTAPVREERRIPVDPHAAPEAEGVHGIIRQIRSDIPAVTHVDYSARVHTVHDRQAPEYHRVIEAFRSLTGCAVVVNTSFNVRSEPIVCSPRDAYTCFMRTGIDMLVLEDFLLRREEQPPLPASDEWRNDYEPD